MHRTFLSVFPLLFLSTFAMHAGEALSVGDPIPEATVFSATGEAVALKDLVSKKPTLLIFYRGGWCPYCTRHLASLGEVENKVLEAGYQIVAISPDQPSAIAQTPGLEKFNYRLFSDSFLEAAEGFGLTFQVPDEIVSKYINEYNIDLEAASGKTHHKLPHPAVYVIGTDGMIRFAHVDENYRERLSNEKILAVVSGE